MPMNPTQLKAYIEKLARERKAKEKAAKAAAGILPGMGDPHRVTLGPVISIGDDDWLHEMRPEGVTRDDEKK